LIPAANGIMTAQSSPCDGLWRCNLSSGVATYSALRRGGGSGVCAFYGSIVALWHAAPTGGGPVIELLDCSQDPIQAIGTLRFMRDGVHASCDEDRVDDYSELTIPILSSNRDEPDAVLFFDRPTATWRQLGLPWTRGTAVYRPVVSQSWKLDDQTLLMRGHRTASSLVDTSTGLRRDSPVDVVTAFLPTDGATIVVGGSDVITLRQRADLELIETLRVASSEPGWKVVANMGPSTIGGHFWAPSPASSQCLLLEEATLNVAAAVPVPGERPDEVGGPYGGKIAVMLREPYRGHWWDLNRVGLRWLALDV
jgi:hypothetical protein